MTDLAFTLIVLGLAVAGLAAWWCHRRRVDALMLELGEALTLAAEAEQVHWRLERRYTPDLGELARLRRDLARFLSDERRGRDTRWELQASEDGSRFDLAILAIPVRGPMRLFGRGRTLGYLRLLTAHGDHGTLAYDSFAEDARYLPRPRMLAPAGR